MTRITITVSGLDGALRKLDQIVDRLKEPERGLIRATNRVADVWRENYDSEGALVGGWPELAERTVSTREYFGFPGSHPILLRYGSLRAIGVEFFQRARSSGRKSASDNYSDEVVSGSLDIDRNRAILQVGGSWKVSNQWGHRNADGSRVPPRPFWFVDRRTVAATKEGVREWLEDEVLR